MRKLLVLALVGLAAQLVDGALGMAYGLTSSTLLLFAGVAPAAASASVHLAEIGTTLAAGVSHWRFGNVDWRVVAPDRAARRGRRVRRRHLPQLDLHRVRRALDGRHPVHASARTCWSASPGRCAPTGPRAGCAAASWPRSACSPASSTPPAAGGWGPVATPALLVSGRIEPRKVIGSVDTSEFLVAGAASLGFLIGLGSDGFLLPTVAALLIGGLIAAPIAAWLVRIVPAQLLGAVIGGVIVLTNTRTLLRAGELGGPVPALAYTVLGAGWLVALVLAARALRRTRPGPRHRRRAADTPAGTGDAVCAGATPARDDAAGDGRSCAVTRSTDLHPGGASDALLTWLGRLDEDLLATPSRCHASTCSVVCGEPIASRSAYRPATLVWVRCTAGGVDPAQQLLVRLVAARSRKQTSENGCGATISNRSSAAHPGGELLRRARRRTRMCARSPSAPYQRSTNHSFSARNRRPSGTCQSR